VEVNFHSIINAIKTFVEIAQKTSLFFREISQ